MNYMKINDVRKFKWKHSHGHCSKKTFRNVGHDDANEEDDSIQPIIPEDEGDDEEWQTE